MQRQDGGRSVHHAKILQDKSKGVVAAKLLHVEAENTCVQAKIYGQGCPWSMPGLRTFHTHENMPNTVLRKL